MYQPLVSTCLGLDTGQIDLGSPVIKIHFVGAYTNCIQPDNWR